MLNRPTSFATGSTRTTPLSLLLIHRSGCEQDLLHREDLLHRAARLASFELHLGCSTLASATSLCYRFEGCMLLLRSKSNDRTSHDISPISTEVFRMPQQNDAARLQLGYSGALVAVRRADDKPTSAAWPCSSDRLLLRLEAQGRRHCHWSRYSFLVANKSASYELRSWRRSSYT